MEKMKSNGFKSLLRRSQLDTRGKFFPMRPIMLWNDPREVVDSLMLDSSKVWLDSCWTILSKLGFFQKRLSHVRSSSNLVFYDSVKT